jgi:hypothetical protein
MRLFTMLFALSVACSAFADVATPISSKPSVVSPRGTFRVEQVCVDRPDSGVEACQVWLVSISVPSRRVQLPEPDEDAARAMYESELRVSPDERYILREQKIYHGAGAAYLYERVGGLDYRVTANPHVDAVVIDLFAKQVGGHDEGMGIVELDAWSSDGKSLVVTLRGRDVAGYDVLDWRCTVDIASGRAYVTRAQAKANAGTFSSHAQRR